MPILMRVDENTRNKSSRINGMLGEILRCTCYAMFVRLIVKRSVMRIEHEDTDKTYVAENILNN